MIEVLDAATESQTGRYLVAETGAIVKVQFDLNEDNYVVNDQYEVCGNTVRPSDDGWQCDCEEVNSTVESGDIEEQCTHIREAKKVARVIFK